MRLRGPSEPGKDFYALFHTHPNGNSYLSLSSYDVGIRTCLLAPEYFLKNGHQFPTSRTDTPFQLALDTHKEYFTWINERAELAHDFHQFMELNQKSQSNWVNWWPVQEEIINGKGTDNVLLVDIGGGKGEYLRSFRNKFPGVSGRLILQDLPEVIESVQQHGPALDGIELMNHDFFTEQPVQGEILRLSTEPCPPVSPL